MIDLTPLTRLGVLLIRPGALIMAAPVFGGTYAPAMIKIGLTLLLAATMWPSTSVPAASTAIALVVVVAHETAVGLALALALQAMVAGAELAGQLIGFQMGLSYSATVDPQSGVRNNVLSSLYGNLTLVTFFLINGHHALLKALHLSYESLPIGAGRVGASAPEAVMRLLGLTFALGAQLAAPVVLVLVLAEVAIGLVSRVAPSLNLLAVGAPIRLLVGLLLLAAIAPVMVGALARAPEAAIQAGLRAAAIFK